MVNVHLAPENVGYVMIILAGVQNAIPGTRRQRMVNVYHAPQIVGHATTMLASVHNAITDLS